MKTVITYGTFDLFHEGHYRVLKRAKDLGDYLIVGVTTEYYDMSRGKLNVVESLMERIDHVRESGFADKIIIEDHIGQKLEDIQKYHVDIFAIGSDWVGKFDYLSEYCKVVYLERTKGVSSTIKRAQTYGVVRTGIVGSGRIAGRFVGEARYVSGIHVEGVYNPKKLSADRFAAEFELDKSSDDYDDFLSDISAVYIASPHETHYDYAKKALTKGKHVLCEKPMVLKKKEAEELFDLARSNGLIMMEAIKTAYAPGFVRLMGIAKSGLIGKIRDVEACFTRLTDGNVRELTNEQTGGSFTEFASYTLLPIVKLFGAEYKELIFKSFITENGIDEYTKMILDYGDRMALSKTGLKVKSDGHLIISGSNGYIMVKPPWWKTTEFEICYEDPTQNEKVYTSFQGDGLRYEISDFVSAINGYRYEDYKLSEKESIAIAAIMEEFLVRRKACKSEFIT